MYELADAVVVGGGVLGLAVTAALSHRLSRVQLIESGRCGTRATAGGFAWVNASSKLEDEAYHRLNAEGCSRHLSLAAGWGQDRTGWTGGGSLIWTGEADPAGRELLDRRLNILQSWNYPVARMSRSEMQALEPNVRFGQDAVGLFAPSEGWVNTALLTRFYMEEARANNADVVEFTRATGFVRGHLGGIAGVDTANGRVSTRVVVICAGADTGALLSDILPAGAPQGRSKKYMSAELMNMPVDARPTTPSGKGFIGSSPGLLAETGPLSRDALVHRVCFPPDRHGLHMRPNAEGGLLLGADDTDAIAASHVQVSGAEESLAAQSLVGRASAVLPGLSTVERAAPRRCIRPMPADGLPIVGALPSLKGVYLLVTHSGITLGPLLAQLLAEEIVTGRISPWLERYRPERLI